MPADTLIKFRPKTCVELIEILPDGDAWVRIEGETDSTFTIPAEDLHTKYEKVLIWD